MPPATRVPLASLTATADPGRTRGNYRLDASKVKASVYVVHGLGDENVKTRQFGEWWDELARRGVPRKAERVTFDDLQSKTEAPIKPEHSAVATSSSAAIW